MSGRVSPKVADPTVPTTTVTVTATNAATSQRSCWRSRPCARRIRTTIDAAPPTRVPSSRTTPSGVAAASQDPGGWLVNPATGLVRETGPDSGLLMVMVVARLMRATPRNAPAIVASAGPRHRPVGSRLAGKITMITTKSANDANQPQEEIHAIKVGIGGAVPAPIAVGFARAFRKPARNPQPIAMSSQPIQFRGRRMASSAPAQVYGRYTIHAAQVVRLTSATSRPASAMTTTTGVTERDMGSGAPS